MKAFLASLVLCAVPAAALAAPANGVDSGRLDIIGHAPSACVIAAPAAQAGANAALQQLDGASATVRIVDLADPMTAQARAAQINLAFPVVCNGAHRLTVRAAGGALRRAGPPAPAAPGFADRVPYQVSANWAGRTAGGESTSLTPIDLAVSDGAAGVLSLVVSIAPGGEPLIAGAYSDSLVVELQAAN